jgi:glycosyltransferase involved in cell wall biosynthesis
MKILLSNKFYYPRGGDCVYILNLEQLLKQHGHEVAIFAMQYPENLPTPWSKYFPNEVKFSSGTGMIESLLRPFGTREVKKKFNALLDDFLPDVVHLNNIHSYLSPVVAEIAHKRGIHVVWTLHDYKLLCPRYDCLRNGKHSCRQCFTDKKQVIKNRCMKSSFVASSIAYLEAIKWNRQKLEEYVNIFICPSQFMKDKMIEGEFNSQKLDVLCNFIDMGKTERASYEKEDYYCYIGRLSSEKGIETLINAASQLPYRLKVVGDGPLRKDVEKKTSKWIEFIGYRQWNEIKEILGKARFMVLPSEGYENNPLSVIESLCLGTPVLGANTGGIPEMISTHRLNTIFKMSDVEDLKEKINYMWNRALSLNERDYRELALISQDRFNETNYYTEIYRKYRK